MNQEELREARARRDVGRLIWALKDPDAEIRGMAAYYVGRIRSAEAGPALVECLGDSSVAVRMTAVKSLARIGDKRAIPAVLRAAERDPDIGVSTQAMDVLAQLGDPRGFGGLVSVLTETDRHLAAGRHEPYVYSAMKWRLKKWSARRLVDLRATGAAPAVHAAIPEARSFRERLLLRRTAWRLRHPPRHRLRPYLWWWATLLGVYVIAAAITGNGSTASAAKDYFAYVVIGLTVLVLLVSGLRR